MPAIHFDAEFYVLVGFALFLGVLLWTGAHSKFTALIDARIDRIKSELAEAERLRGEAEALLASFEKKREEAEAVVKYVHRMRTEMQSLFCNTLANSQRLSLFVTLSEFAKMLAAHRDLFNTK